MACGCGTYSITTTHPCNITAEVCFNYYIDITPYGTALSITDPPVNGEATILPNGNIRYTHNGENYDGDPFEYSFSGGSNGTGTCTVGIKVLEAIPPNTKVITLTASGECEVGNPTFEWELPECAELAPGYDIHDNPINVIVPIYDPENPDATCEIKVHVCCDYCNNCCKCEHYIWTPPECTYPCGSDPICSCSEPCHTYNPSTGSCEPCGDGLQCCTIGEDSYTCRECCDIDDCPSNQECISGTCGCPPGTVENEYGACCPTTLPSCAVCDNAGNVVESVNLDCDENEEIDYETCTCVCLEGLCKDIITGDCVECPPCIPTAGRLRYSGVSGYEAFTETCPACQHCVACGECPGGFECVDAPCAATGSCNGELVPLIPNPLPFVSYTDPCTGLTVTCSEEAPCCCKKNPPPTITTFICQDDVCYPHSGPCDEEDDNCYENIEDCNDECGDHDDPDIGACCVGNDCYHMTAEACEVAGGIFSGINSLCEDVEPCIVEVVGACCKDSVCYTATQEDCEADGGTYVGNGVDCEEDTCDEVNPLCTSFPEIDVDYTCGNLAGIIITNANGRNLQREKRDSSGDSFVVINPNIGIITNNYSFNINFDNVPYDIPVGGQVRLTILATDDCPAVVVTVTRAACLVPLIWCCAEGVCSNITAAACMGLGGIIYNNSHTCGINCLPDVTPLPMGCCHNGNCTEVYDADECAGILYGTPAECQETCLTVGPPDPTGACCISGECYGGMTEDDCVESGGEYIGDNTTCVGEDCESPCEDIITTGVITEGDGPIVPQNYIYIPAWSNGNSI